MQSRSNISQLSWPCGSPERDSAAPTALPGLPAILTTHFVSSEAEIPFPNQSLSLALTRPRGPSKLGGRGEQMANFGSSNLELFPILTRFPPQSTGIARLAAASSPAGEGYRMELRSLPVRSVLNRSVSRRGLRFAWSINPYRGCEFACRYCYARYTHEFMELQPEDFERKIFIKQNAAWLLEQELKQVRPGEEIALGTATDPYQPAERRERVTESILEVLARQHSLRIGLGTKSTLIERDIPLLQRGA